MNRVAVLDDYQGVALQMADWGALPRDVEVQVFRDHLRDPHAIIERLRGFEIIVAMRERTPFPKSILEQLPDLKLLVTTGMRNGSIDVAAATTLGVTVCGTRGVNSATAELTWGLILAAMRHIPREDRATRQGQWETTVGQGLEGKTLGIIGLGKQGSPVAKVGKAFGMSILAWSQHLTDERAAECGAELVGKDELLSQSDVVTLHVVLSDRTRGLIGARELSLMKRTAHLVNTSRGPVIDEKALIDVLKKGAIAGAALDVFDEEPLPPGHPFTTLENLVITPHLGYVTVETYRVFFGDAVEDVKAFLAGAPVRVLN